MNTPKETWEDQLCFHIENLIIDIGTQVTDDYKRKNGRYEGMSIKNVRSIDAYLKKLKAFIAHELELARREALKDFLCNFMTYINIIQPESSAFIKKVDKVLNEYLATLREEKEGTP